MLILKISDGDSFKIYDRADGATPAIEIKLVCDGRHTRVVINADRRYDVVRSNAILKEPKRKDPKRIEGGTDAKIQSV